MHVCNHSTPEALYPFDARGIAKRFRHAAIFGAFEALLPGETMRVHIQGPGKEPHQGVGYLDDGTMIVVENGHRHLGATIDVEVTSALQTAAGRMIFAKPKT